MDLTGKKFLNIIKFPVLALFFFILGTYVGFQNRPSISKIFDLSNTATPVSADTADFEPFWKVWSTINEKYPDSVNSQEKIWGAIQGLTASLGDPYSEFFPPEDNKAFTEEISGEFGGIGVEIDVKDGDLVVIAPLSGSPAEKAGLLPGDKIIAINGTNTAGLTIDESISLIRGEIGTFVALTISRKDSETTTNIDVERKVITIPTVKTDNSIDQIFVIHFFSFSLHADKEFQKALAEFLNSGKKKLIIDLRGNPGGYLDHAIDTASWFLPAGTPVVIESGINKEETIYRSKGYNLFGKDYKIVILVDGGSASASEIFAGALQEYGKATLIGEQTYGKGSVQELIPITDDTSLKLTVAKWLTPNRISISKTGITPDIVVPVTKDDILKNIDPQLEMAIKTLNLK